MSRNTSPLLTVVHQTTRLFDKLIANVNTNKSNIILLKKILILYIPAMRIGKRYASIIANRITL